MNCENIQDLLVLYIDNTCGQNTKDLIEEHLKTCPKCRKILEQMVVGDIAQQSSLKSEDEIRDVLLNTKKTWK